MKHPDYITMSWLGRYGRFANQLFQYAFLRIYAQQHGLKYQMAPWVGEELFGLSPSPVTVALPPYHEIRPDGNDMPYPPPIGRAACGRDFRGYAQHHTSFYAPHRKNICEWYRPTRHAMKRLGPAQERLWRQGRTRIGIHLRRGDYGQHAFYITPVEWYLRWLDHHWWTFDRPVLFVATEDKSLVDEFAEYAPQTTESLGLDLSSEPLTAYPYLALDLEKREPWQMDFYPDFYLLSRCEVILMPNSTFSFVAAMLNPRLKQAWRSHLPTQRFVQIDPWFAEPLTRDLAEDYRHIPGVCLDANEYWP
jgi:hypothetical protein